MGRGCLKGVGWMMKEKEEGLEWGREEGVSAWAGWFRSEARVGWVDDFALSGFFLASVE